MSPIDTIAQSAKKIQISFLNKESRTVYLLILKKAFDIVNCQFFVCNPELYGKRGLPLAVIKKPATFSG